MIKINEHTRLLLFVFLFVILAGPGQSALCAENAVSRYVEGLIDSGTIPGAVCLVARGSDLLMHEAWGFRDIEKNLPMQTDTLCWGASIMKPVTVATAMTCVEAGKLDLDDTVEQYLPQFKNQMGPAGRHYPITIKQLMSHSSGLGNPPSRIELWPRCAALHPSWLTQDLDDIVGAIAEVPLRFVPGTEVSYSNAAPFVLARVAEIVSGQSWGQLVQTRILNEFAGRD